MRLLFAALVALLLGACAGGPRLGDLHPGTPRVELTATPFFPQEQFQCGPAALATVLVASGVDVSPDQLVAKVYVPEREGSLRTEMVAATRSHGRVPYLLTGSLRDLVAELDAGNPVLVMQNLGLSFWPAWHYAVVIGYDTENEVVVLRSGTQQRREMSTFQFVRSWELADGWALMAARPGQLPFTATIGDWLQAASAFEALGDPQTAETAYLAAALRWPEHPLPWQLLGNARYAQGRLKDAESALREALDRVDSAATRNNLAHVLMERGCTTQASAEIEHALGIANGDADQEILLRTRQQIRTQTEAGTGDCAQVTSPSP